MSDIEFSGDEARTGQEGDGEELLDSLGVTAINAAQLEHNVLAKVSPKVACETLGPNDFSVLLLVVSNFFVIHDGAHEIVSKVRILKQASEGLKDASIPEEGEAVLLTQLWQLNRCILVDTEESW